MGDLTTNELEAMAARLEAAAEEIRALHREHDGRLIAAAAEADGLSLGQWERRARDLARRSRALEKAAARLRQVVEIALEDVETP